MMPKTTSCENFSSLDLLEKLNLLEKLVFHKLISVRSGKKSDNNMLFNNNLKLLLEIIKLKHKIKPKDKEIDFLNLLNFTNNNNSNC